jgi:hypothetical protein
MVIIIGPKDVKKYSSVDVINTTSSSKDWGRQLSPFFLGPVKINNNKTSFNLENAWQYSKCYKEFIDENDNVSDKYYKWAHNGWNTKWAVRYPMGKGASPLFSLWNGKRLDYIEARKEIYIPLYIEAVRKTEAYKKLKQIYKEKGKVVLFDFDGYEFEMTKTNFNEVVDNPHKKMGHAFVLAKLLLEDSN